MQNGPASPTQRFYRIIRTRSLRRDYFASYGELGIKPKRPLTRREEERWWGVSVYSSLAGATRLSDDSPWLGRYVAVVEIPFDVDVRFQQTGRDPTHFTIWARAEDLLRWVVAVMNLDDVH